MKTALITGITGQDGSFLADLLIEKGYCVHGVRRRSSSFNTGRIDHLINKYGTQSERFYLHYGDLTDGLSLSSIIDKCSPNEVYNLAAQSHVAVSFEAPEYTAEVAGLGTLRLLDILRSRASQCKFYQASTSELYGANSEVPQSETTPFDPVSPYAAAKQFAYEMVKIYRQSYGLFASNGILFNHESERRGETFVTRKITLGLTKYKLGLSNGIKLGNLNALRDWGYAKDFVEAQWLILQQSEADDYVIATGQQISVRQFCEKVCEYLRISIDWTGYGLNEKAINRENGEIVISVDEEYFRPLEVNTLLGDSTKAQKALRWKPKTEIDELVQIMCDADLRYWKKNGL